MNGAAQPVPVTAGPVPAATYPCSHSIAAVAGNWRRLGRGGRRHGGTGKLADEALLFAFWYCCMHRRATASRGAAPPLQWLYNRRKWAMPLFIGGCTLAGTAPMWFLINAGEQWALSWQGPNIDWQVDGRLMLPLSFTTVTAMLPSVAERCRNWPISMPRFDFYTLAGHRCRRCRWNAQ